MEHTLHGRAVLSLLHKDGVIFNDMKRMLSAKKINYLGHIFRPDKLDLAYHTTDAISDFKKTLHNVADLNSLLLMRNVYHSLSQILST